MTRCYRYLYLTPKYLHLGLTDENCIYISMEDLYFFIFSPQISLEPRWHFSHFPPVHPAVKGYLNPRFVEGIYGYQLSWCRKELAIKTGQ